MPKRMQYDPVLFYTIATLLLTGLFMVGSASHYEALRWQLSPHAILIKHFVYSLIGLAGFYIALKIPYRLLTNRKLIFAMIMVSVIALIAVFFMPETKGAHRWLRLGGLSLQPSEFVKLVSVIFIASLLARREHLIDRFWSVTAPCAFVIGSLTLLIVVEPDLGTAFMLCLVCATMLFVAGLPWRLVGLGTAVGIIGIASAILSVSYRRKRLLAFFDPEADVQGVSWQLIQSRIALGSGGWFGVGPGKGTQKAGFLPEPHTDFVFSVVGEELGMMGTLFLLAAFLIIFWRGLRAAKGAPDRFGFYLALGLTCLLTFQAFIHFGVCLGLLPTKGLPLPFISAGGSALIASMMGMGLLINVSQYSN